MDAEQAATLTAPTIVHTLPSLVMITTPVPTIHAPFHQDVSTNQSLVTITMFAHRILALLHQDANSLQFLTVTFASMAIPPYTTAHTLIIATPSNVTSNQMELLVASTLQT